MYLREAITDYIDLAVKERPKCKDNYLCTTVSPTLLHMAFLLCGVYPFCDSLMTRKTFLRVYIVFKMALRESDMKLGEHEGFEGYLGRSLAPQFPVFPC
jgi:hypothetical protein